jgi:DNA-binding SARP family transcriptional activator
MQRALLALLLLHANTFLSSSRIIDTLWAGRPPRTAPAALQMYVTAVRRALAPAGAPHQDKPHQSVLQTKPSGYRLWVAAGQLDLEEFRALAAHGRALRASGRCRLAAGVFRRALELWRGPALLDLEAAGNFDPYVARMEEERLGVRQERIGVDICQGGSLAVVGELTELHERRPLVESVAQQLMMALYLAGRRADALRIYTRIREVLVSEIGIEPGPGLQATQRAILGNQNFPELGYPQHSTLRPAPARACEPRLFGGWPRGQPPEPYLSRAAR